MKNFERRIARLEAIPGFDRPLTLALLRAFLADDRDQAVKAVLAYWTPRRDELDAFERELLDATTSPDPTEADAQ
jgi:hypothetical protein